MAPIASSTRLTAKRPSFHCSIRLAIPVSQHCLSGIPSKLTAAGLFVTAAIVHGDKLEGKRLLAASAYYSAEEVVDTFSAVTGKKAVFVQVTPDQFKASLPDVVAQEFLENHLFIEEPGYYLGEPLDESLKLLDSKPVDWATFVKKNASAWA